MAHDGRQESFQIDSSKALPAAAMTVTPIKNAATKFMAGKQQQQFGLVYLINDIRRQIYTNAGKEAPTADDTFDKPTRVFVKEFIESYVCVGTNYTGTSYTQDK